MRILFFLAAPCVAALAVLSIENTADARAPRPAAVIVTPKRDDLVSREAEVFGKLLLPGRPVVLVREDQPGSFWHVQDAGQPIDGKTFKSRVTFGSGHTPQGRRFFVMVVLVRNAKQLAAFQPRAAIDDIPWDMPRSAQIPVVLDRRAEPRPQANWIDRPAPEGSGIPVVPDRWEEPEPRTNLIVEPTPESTPESKGSPVVPDQIENPQPQTSLIVRPTPGSKVSRVEELVAVVDDGAPVAAMVRSNESGSYWWVQDIIESAPGGKVTAAVRFGNQSTQPGSRFSIVLLLPKSLRDLKQLQVGDYMRHLPDRIPKSKEVEVILE